MITILPKFKNRYEEKKIYKFKIRQFYTKGISPSEEPIESFENSLEDEFLKVNGKEIY